MKQVTIKDVAEAARCSTTLVSRVMNAPIKEDGTPDCVVNPKTAERIFETVRALGYRPNKAAVSLRKKLQKRIGVILPDLSNQFFAGIARHFESIARKNGYIVLFGSSNDNAEQLGHTAEVFMEDGVDGIIIIPGAKCHDAVRKVIDRGIPTVLTIRDIPEAQNVGKVLLDSAKATRMTLDHLIEKGYRRIDMLSLDKRFSIVEERERLYAEYMEDRCMQHKIFHTSDSDEDLAIILEQAFRNGTEALYCISARLPIRCLTVGKSIGIRFPDDIALTGYDGGNLYDALSPTITQIEFPREEIAKEAFNTLMEMIESPDKTPLSRHIEGKLTIGESTTRTIISDDKTDDNCAISEIRNAIDSLKRALDSMN